MTRGERGMASSRDRPPIAAQGVVLILAGAQIEIPGYWNLQLDVGDRATRVSRDGRVYQRQTLESRAASTGGG
jgi:hypothetical protein